MSVRLVEMWRCDGGCGGEVTVDVNVAPAYVLPPGWAERDGGDVCPDCLTERNRVYGGGVGG